MTDKTIQLEQRIKILENVLFGLILSDRIEINKLLKFQDGINIEFSTNHGLKIGTSASQKVALHGATPTIQSSKINDPSISAVSGSGADAVINANFSALESAVQALIDVDEAKGLSASS